MIAIRIIVPDNPEFYDECDTMTLLQYTQDTEERHSFAAGQIAGHFDRYNVRFPRERSIPFQVEVLYFPLEQEIEYKNIVEMLSVTDTAIRDFERGPDISPKNDIERMRNLLKLHDKLTKMGQVLTAKSAEIKHTISKLLENHKELYL